MVRVGGNDKDVEGKLHRLTLEDHGEEVAENQKQDMGTLTAGEVFWLSGIQTADT